MLGVGELRQWITILADAARGRVPRDLQGGGDEPDDRRLDAYLLRASALGAAGGWTRGRLLPAVEAGFRADGFDAAAGLTREALAVREAAAALPLPGLGLLIGMAIMLGAIALVVSVLIRLGGRRPVPWRILLATALSAYLVFALWGLAAFWTGLKLGAFLVPEPDAVIGARDLAGRALVVLLVAASLVAPAIALGRAARIVAPRLRFPFAAGVLAWAGALALDAAATAAGLERAVVRLLAMPAG